MGEGEEREGWTGQVSSSSRQGRNVPYSPKLFESDGPVVVLIEHAYHQANGHCIKGCEFVVHQCLLQLLLSQLPRAVRVHGSEEREELRAASCSASLLKPRCGRAGGV